MIFGLLWHADSTIMDMDYTSNSRN